MSWLKKRNTPLYILGLVSVFLIILDQWVKYWARTYLQPIGSRVVLQGLFNLTYTENRGAAFGIFQGGRWPLLLLTLVILTGITVYFIRLPKEPHFLWARIPLTLVFTGAVGNFIDRLLLGYVTDLFEFAFITFPIFNVADICLVSGTIALAFAILFILKEPF